MAEVHNMVVEVITSIQMKNLITMCLLLYYNLQSVTLKNKNMLSLFLE